MTLELADGRGELFQWDTGRIIEFGEDAVSQAHFTNTEKITDIPYTIEVKNRKAVIPDELLQVPGTLIVYAWVSDTNGGYTKVQVNFPVFARPKPSDYVYTPTEHAGFDRLRAEIGDLSALKTDAKDTLVSAINEAAASGGADWNQNDPAAKDYVKNRTHYRSIEQATMTVSAGLGAALVNIVPFAPGDVVDITVNGKEMSLTAASDVLQGPSGQSRSLTYVGDSPSSIVSGAAPVYGWTVALLDGMCMAQTYGNDCTFGYTAYVYTRLPIEYSPIIVETDVGSSSVFVPVSKIKIDGSINVAKRIFIDADMDGKGNAEIEIKGELGEYSYMEYVLLAQGIYVAKYDSNTFILKPENLIVTNLKEYLNDWRQKNVRFQSVEVDGIKYSALLHGFERGLSGTFCTVNAHLYSVVIDFGSTIKSEWFDQDWKLTIKKIL